MPDTLPVPDELPERDRQRVEHVNRNIRIRSAYPSLRDEHGRDEALQRIAQKEDVSTALVREVVYGRR